MWKVTAFRNNVWTPIEPIVVNERPSTTAVRFAAQRAFPTSSGFLSHLEDEDERNMLQANGKRDAIEIWSKSAEDEAREYDWAGTHKIVAVEEALGLYLGDEPDSVAATLAWHDHTMVIIPVTGPEQQIMIEYTPRLRDENRAARLRHRYASPDHELEVIFDWRGYFGDQSAIIDGWTKMTRRGKRFFASIRKGGGFIVGTILNRLKEPEPTLTLKNDPRAKRQLTLMEDHYPNIATNYPDLSEIIPVHNDRAVVFVHGMVSCGIHGLNDLFQTNTPDFPVFRYEHDTFHTIKANGDALAGLIEEHLNVSKLLLVAHSRGGLVSKWALHQLAKNNYPAEMELFTFGTPHLGSPLVNIGGRLLNQLFKLGEGIINSIPMMSPLTMAYSTLIDAPELPPGINVMAEGNEALLLLNDLGVEDAVKCWGSDFDENSHESGFGIEVEGVLLGAMGGTQHDLLVPLHSALAFGTAQPSLICSHLNYFSQPQIQNAILTYFGEVEDVEGDGIQVIIEQPSVTEE